MVFNSTAAAAAVDDDGDQQIELVSAFCVNDS